MPDDLQIPVPGSAQNRSAPISASYRARRPASETPRWMVLAALGLGGSLLLGLGGWAMMGRKPVDIPVIEADSRPLRIKPENPGGMQIAGADEAVMGGHAGGTDRMAPVAETPAPQALRAQMQPVAPVPVSPTPAASGPAAPGPAAPGPVSAAVTPVQPGSGPVATAGAPGVSPLPDTPARVQPGKPATAAPAPAPANAPALVQAPAARPAGAAGGTLVQLAALETEAAAQSEWAKLAKRMPELLASRRPVVQRAERDGKPVWRVRTGGFSDVADATSFCGKVRAKGANCTIASF